jgi:predicted ABC-type ATPase
MSKETPRLRMFAGPNGSGKSTLKSIIGPDLLGIYINPDEIEKEIRQYNHLDLQKYQVQTDANEVIEFFNNSHFLKSINALNLKNKLHFDNGKLFFQEVEINAYFASVAADFIRNKLIENSKSFTFETVMSFPDKIELLQKAQAKGYRTYLYFVATEDPSINVSRVQYRVKMGGHSVPEDKIVSRYKRSLDLLIQAIKFANRSYIFDNSTQEHVWLAEITNGELLEMKTDQVPVWFKKSLLDKI